MNDVYLNLRVQLRSRFIDYLKADSIPYYPPELTVSLIAGHTAPSSLTLHGHAMSAIITATWWTM